MTISEHSGYFTKRLTQTNQKEIDYSNAWIELHKNTDFLNKLLTSGGKSVVGEVTDRDRKIAATIIQWLGSSVGESFVSEVGVK